MIVNVVKAGLYSTLQDGGRVGYAHEGIPQGGAMDLENYELCNSILGNDTSEPVIECTMMGPTISFDSPAVIAITGSDLSPAINRIPMMLHRPTSVNTGDQLSFGRLKYGCRCYIGVAGNWEVERWQGSVSPLIYGDVLTENILKKGAKIEIKTELNGSHPIVEIDKETYQDSPHQLELFKGPEYDLFSKELIQEFLSARYTVNNASNRMGYRLDGFKLDTTHLPPMVSSGVLPGTIQITSAGTPIILGRDAQTIGGYPRIGILTETSLNQMAHMKPNDQVTFKLT